MKRSFFSQPWLVIAVMLPIVMVFNDVNILFGISAVLIVFWKLMAEKLNVYKLGRIATTVIAILVFIFVLQKFRTVLTQESALSLLIILSALKIMDYENSRDHKFLCLLSFILVVVKSMYAFQIFWLPPSAASIFLIWVSLLDSVVKDRFRYVISILMYSLPISLLLFFFFPRIGLPWSPKQAEGKFESGFSASLSSGQISNLALNANPVFRAEFNSDSIVQPFINQLYWTGTYLSDAQGFAWKEGTAFGKTLKRKTAGARLADVIHYSIQLEPQEQSYLFGLESLLNVTLEDEETTQPWPYVFKATPSSKPRFYSAVSLLYGVEPNKVDAQLLRPLLQVPHLPKQTQELIQEIKKKQLSDPEKINELKSFFSNGQFKYSLQPGSYSDQNGLDQFLFQRRVGFCEHYASAFGILTRALGIPSVVAVGYQGGEFNPIGKYWLVRQSDAHVWNLIYVNNQWKRVDPVKWVAPLRLELNSMDFYNMSDAEAVDYLKTKELRDWNKNKIVRIWNRVVLFLDSLNYKYTSFLLAFDKQGQQDFLKQNGQLLLILVFAVVLVLWVLRRGAFRKNSKKKKAQRRMLKLLRKLTKMGYERPSSQAPISFLISIDGLEQKLQSEITKVITVYEKDMYEHE